MGTERDQLKRSKKTSTQHVHTGTWYLVLCFVPCTALFSKESTAQLGAAPQRRAKHGIAPNGTAPHDAVLLSYYI